MTRHIFAACGAIAIAGLTLSAQTPQSSPTQPPGTRTPTDNGRSMTMTGCLKPWDGTMGAGAVGSGSTPGSGAMGSGSATGAGSTGSAGATGSTGAGSTAGAGQSASGSAGSMGAGTQFVLTNISEGAGNSATGAAGEAGRGTTTAPTPRMGHGSIVLKTSDSSINLKQHVNHKVEVTGTMSGDMGGHGSMSGTTPGSTPGSTGSSTGSQTAGSPSTMGKPSADQMKMPTFTVTALKMVSATCD